MKYEPILKEYALYRDNKLLAFGTAKRIAEQLGMQEKHIHTLASDAYKKTVSEGSMQAFLLEEDDYSTLEGEDLLYSFDRAMRTRGIKLRDEHICAFVKSLRYLKETFFE